MEPKPPPLADVFAEKWRTYRQRLGLIPGRRKEPPRSPQGLLYAGFERRLMAASLDSVLIALVLMPFNAALMGGVEGAVNARLEAVFTGNPLMTPEQMQAVGLIYASGILLFFQGAIYLAYAAAWHWAISTTPGKWVLRLRVVDARSGERLRPAQAVFRSFAYVISALPLCLGFLAIGWHPRKQGWHDRLARTAVVALPFAKKENSPPPE